MAAPRQSLCALLLLLWACLWVVVRRCVMGGCVELICTITTIVHQFIVAQAAGSWLARHSFKHSTNEIDFHVTRCGAVNWFGAQLFPALASALLCCYCTFCYIKITVVRNCAWKSHEIYGCKFKIYAWDLYSLSYTLTLLRQHTSQRRQTVSLKTAAWTAAHSCLLQLLLSIIAKWWHTQKCDIVVSVVKRLYLAFCFDWQILK